MTGLFYAAAMALLVTVALALVRAWKGPGTIDRIMAAQLVGTGVIGVALTLGAARGDATMLDAALVATLLAALAVAAFVASRAPRGARKDGEDRS
ncbi:MULTISPECIES: monovalent cation/H+ antiporter complex subunit F [Alphaproteobacteria]|jgi:multicomponent Na+:H+ antiporter subunit F|uniref:Multicomponent Na+:H+ antiporter subunit F n=1 Tax=Paracoccus tibetensis TaxID=336292 RepID=A0A1G5K846_9RHOB|nr:MULTISPECIES: monovalent cation/H+ antiporter complex subunit F [Alphaproteobacteria]KRW97707.1 hypothetical protein AQY21_02130 [Paracoccus sp. MKU1]SCY96796.1 multicomponent Na+:H+ antiporter subunit F [Paracoccus tibetensis]